MKTFVAHKFRALIFCKYADKTFDSLQTVKIKFTQKFSTELSLVKKSLKCCRTYVPRRLAVACHRKISSRYQTKNVCHKWSKRLSSISRQPEVQCMEFFQKYLNMSSPTAVTSAWSISERSSTVLARLGKRFLLGVPTGGNQRSRIRRCRRPCPIHLPEYIAFSYYWTSSPSRLVSGTSAPEVSHEQFDFIFKGQEVCYSLDKTILRSSKTSETDWQVTQRRIPEERSSQTHRGEKLQTRMLPMVCWNSIVLKQNLCIKATNITPTSPCWKVFRKLRCR